MALYRVASWLPGDAVWSPWSDPFEAKNPADAVQAACKEAECEPEFGERYLVVLDSAWTTHVVTAAITPEA